MTLDKLTIKGNANANDFTDRYPPCDQQAEIIDKIDCLQRDLAAFKAYLIQHVDEAIDSALRKRRESKRYREPGYR